MTKEQLLDMLQREVDRAGSQAAWAAQHRIGPSYVSDVLLGRREPGKAIVQALGLERELVYRRRDESPRGRA